MQVQHFADWLGGMLGPLGIVVAAVFAAIAGLYLLSKVRERSLARERAGADEDTFVQDLSAKGLDAAIASMVYEYLRDVQKVPFPMLPEDSLDEKLGVANEDLEETIQACLTRAQREARPGLMVVPPDTMEDLVRYIQQSPRLIGGQTTSASGVFPMQRDGVRSSSGSVRKATLR